MYIKKLIVVLGILLPERSTSVYSPKKCSSPMLFRFVACFARVRIEDSSRNRFVSKVYLLPDNVVSMHAFHGGNVQEGNNRGGTFRGYFAGGEYSGHRLIVPSLLQNRHIKLR